MFRWLSRFIYFRIFGWKIEGLLPSDLKKYIIIGAPHTSNWDFVLAILVRSILGLKANWLGKSSLFKFPFGWLFRSLGGYPVRRSVSQNMVEQVTELFEQKDNFVLGLAPEGTRKYVPKWKTGFYFIAKNAAVPIVMIAIDYGTKTFRINKPFYTSDDFETDFEEIAAFFKTAKGRYPEQTTY